VSASLGSTDKLISSKKPQQPARAFAVGWNDVQVRPFSERDIDSVLDFYYRSPRDLPMLQDLDFAKVPAETQMRQALSGQIPSMMIVTIEYKGRAVGIHQLFDIRDGQADFSAVLWNADVRGKGIGAVSWYKACQYFFDSFPSLQVLLFKAPKTNPYSAKLAKKLPLKLVGQEELASPMIKAGIQADVYSVTRTEFENLHNEDELDELE
jgi:RimJ/RimL family protein N-acetyltransferase